MLDLVLKLIERLIKLGERREQLRERDFTRFVDPTYRSAERVYANFIGVLDALDLKLNRARKVQPLLRFLRSERLQLLSVRLQLRTTLAKLWERGDQFSAFENGIAQLLGASAHPQFRPRDPFLPMNHAFENMISRLETCSVASADLGTARDWLRFELWRERQRLDKAWQAVTEGYVSLQLQLTQKRETSGTNI